MTFNINNFNMKFGGARPSLFQVDLVPPTLPTFAGAGMTGDLQIKAFASAVPSSTVEPIPVAFKGRLVNFSGPRTYNPWTITVYNDEDFVSYNSILEWLRLLNEPQLNKRTAGGADPSRYKASAIIRQYGQEERQIASWKVYNLFPISCSELELNWSSGNQIQTFQATFSVDWVDKSAV